LNRQKALSVILGRREHTFNPSIQSELIDLLLDIGVIIDETAVLDAIDSGNYIGLNRILERRNGKLDFDANIPFEDPRFLSNELEKHQERFGGFVVYRNYRRTCVSYAVLKEMHPFVSLMRGYNWDNDSEYIPPYFTVKNASNDLESGNFPQ
jgi:hypothetical protein